ncbi:Fc.00g084500.m01.CDS01 [Cosmosporella sp. VM-42]
MFGPVLTLALAAVASALPTTIRYRSAEPAQVEARAVSDSYKGYSGDGSLGAAWPGMTSWSGFEELWNANVPLMRQSCGWNGWGADNSDNEINGIKSAIKKVAGETGVEKKFILAIVMQESKGCVRVPTTNNGVSNPGLMQSHNGSGSCAGVNPCPNSTILQMIRDGTSGTSSGEGLKQILAKTISAAGSRNARAHYAAARKYNSGSVDYSNLNYAFTSTPCYASDVANRLTGWTMAASQCHA